MAKPSRRSVMKAFGDYVDWVEWLNNVKLGLEDPPEGETIGDMALGAKRLEARYRKRLSEYLGIHEEEETE